MTIKLDAAKILARVAQLKKDRKDQQ